MKHWIKSCLLASVVLAVPVQAADTIKYSYDAKGRLKKVERLRPAVTTVQTDYSHDKANNRKTLVTTGSPNPPVP